MLEIIIFSIKELLQATQCKNIPGQYTLEISDVLSSYGLNYYITLEEFSPHKFVVHMTKEITQTCEDVQEF